MMIHILKLLINMRIISFRGLDSNTNKWLYGYLSWYESPEKGLFINGKPVIPESVGQFTGLYDIDGKEIYEGDVVRLKFNIGKIENFNNYEIRWSDDECSFVLHDEESEHYGSKTLTRKLIRDKELKVIGNIYENKQLP